MEKENILIIDPEEGKKKAKKVGIIIGIILILLGVLLPTILFVVHDKTNYKLYKKGVDLTTKYAGTSSSLRNDEDYFYYSTNESKYFDLDEGTIDLVSLYNDNNTNSFTKICLNIDVYYSEFDVDSSLTFVNQKVSFSGDGLKKDYSLTYKKGTNTYRFNEVKLDVNTLTDNDYKISKEIIANDNEIYELTIEKVIIEFYLA